MSARERARRQRQLERLARAAEMMKALGDPIRMDIVELLGLTPDVNFTAAELAEHVGVRVTNLYYHINVLERHGLIVVGSTRVVNGIVEKRYCASEHLALGYENLLAAVKVIGKR
jgi:DNA-binding transcriptional ArsR family regulator